MELIQNEVPVTNHVLTLVLAIYNATREVALFDDTFRRFLDPVDCPNAQKINI